MAKTKNTETVKAEASSKKAVIRFNPKTYVEINANMTDFSKSIVSAEINGTTTEYSLGGGSYEEVLLWTNSKPTTGFTDDKPLINFDNPEYDFYKITWLPINNAPNKISTAIFSKEALSNSSVTLGSSDEASNNFSRAIIPVVKEINTNSGVYETWLVADGLCSQIGAANDKKFRCIPQAVYGVTVG